MTVTDLVAALAADDDLVDELVAAARATSPEVARLPVDENRRHVRDLLAAGLSAFGSPDGDFGAATALGADRAAQGVPITALLSGVQAGRARIVEIAVARGRAAGVPDAVLLDAMRELDRYTNAVERLLVDGYQRGLAMTARDARSHVLRSLLRHDEDVPAGALAQAGLDPAGRYVCLVTDVADPGRAVGLRGVVGMVDGRLAGLAPCPPHGPVDVVACLTPNPPSRPLDFRVVVGPATALADAHTVYRLCLAALDVADSPGIHPLTALAPQSALAAQPELAKLVANDLLSPLDPTNPFHRELAATALSYLDHNHRVDRTAKALHVHPNTVRYRLDRLHTLTTFPDDAAMAETLRWWWALRVWLSG